MGEKEAMLTATRGFCLVNVRDCNINKCNRTKDRQEASNTEDAQKRDQFSRDSNRKEPKWFIYFLKVIKCSKSNSKGKIRNSKKALHLALSTLPTYKGL